MIYVCFVWLFLLSPVYLRYYMLKDVEFRSEMVPHVLLVGRRSIYCTSLFQLLETIAYKSQDTSSKLSI